MLVIPSSNTPPKNMLLCARAYRRLRQKIVILRQSSIFFIFRDVKHHILYKISHRTLQLITLQFFTFVSVIPNTSIIITE